MSCPNCHAPLELIDSPAGGEILSCYACGWEADQKKEMQHALTVGAVLLAMVGVAAFWMGTQHITLSDLSQQRAREISHAVAQQCDEKFVTPLEKAKAGEPAIRQAAARCSNVADLALEAVYAAGVSPVDEVMERAKKIAHDRHLRKAEEKKP